MPPRPITSEDLVTLDFGSTGFAGSGNLGRDLLIAGLTMRLTEDFGDQTRVIRKQIKVIRRRRLLPHQRRAQFQVNRQQFRQQLGSLRLGHIGQIGLQLRAWQGSRCFIIGTDAGRFLRDLIRTAPVGFKSLTDLVNSAGGFQRRAIWSHIPVLVGRP